MNKIDFSHLGGYPLDQDALDFLQNSYSSALSAVAKLCGDKTILCGVVSDGTNVSAGWISYNEELVAFLGGPIGANVVITSTPTSVVFEDNTLYPVEITKVAACGALGAFPFTDLQPLLALKNIWKKDDLRMCYKDNAYVDANFDAVTGIGQNDEVGWQLLDKAYPASAGKAFVNRDSADANFDEAGKVFGEKDHTLSGNEMPTHDHFEFNTDVPTVGGGPGVVNAGNYPTRALNTGTALTYEIHGSATIPTLGKSSPSGGGVAHNNIQPSMAILTLIKL